MELNDSNEATDSSGASKTSYSLVNQAKGNDSEAWERLVKLYSPLVYFWCQESGLPQADVQDIFQDVFCSLSRSIGNFRSIENGTFRGWLRTLTRNKVNDHYRKAGRQVRPTGGTEALKRMEQFPAVKQKSHSENYSKTSSKELDFQHSMLCKALKNIRESFSEQTWKAFWMVVVVGRETSDVAKDLSMLPGTVRVAKFRVLKRLRLEIGDSTE